ncbi:hypothetical protein BW247_08845 [Acidihalobacter ferrooxydans]|uniref:CusB-like beta-barrel domain-containing protein n=2 Tax=Acidihalobacter ferrooxydans TaxID=1765967 RepID=A0A1P8ULB6_9GAMM|nr:hypothetical protein BW247_08845 [Acidihalobacter ferrooxydans]
MMLLASLACAQPALASPGIYKVKEMQGVGSTLGGYVIPRYEVTLSAQAPGRVSFVLGGAGTPVTQDSVLVRLGEAGLLAKRAEAVASFYSAQAAWQNSIDQYGYQLRQYNPMSSWMNPFAWGGQGMATLLGRGVSSPMASYAAGVANRAADQTIARAKLESARARIHQIDAALRDTVSVAPFNGVVLSKNVNVGDSVQPGQPLMTIASGGARQVELRVPDAMAAQLRVGQALWVNLSGVSSAIAGTVAEIDPQADPRTHTVTLKLDLPTDVSPRLGSYAQVVFPSHDRYAQVPVVPMSALLPGHSLPSVLVIKNGHSQLRVLRLGEELQGGLVQVLAGLHAGETVIVSPPPGAAAGYMPPTSSGKAAGGAEPVK